MLTASMVVNMPPVHDPATLLAEHVGWMRSLARRLVRDADQADDLAQDAAAATLQSPPSDGARVRGFLRRILENRHREVHRARRNVLRRELVAAQRERGQSAPATDDLVARVQTQRRVAGLLVGLEEPYRTVLLLRFYEDLPPRRIAERTGATVATVKSQLHRGLARLRARLDADAGGDRGAWLAALVPLCGWRATSSVATFLTATWIMNSKLIIVSSLLASVAVGIYLWSSSPPTAAPSDEAPARVAASGFTGGGGGADSANVVAKERAEPRRSERRALAAPPTSAPASYSVRGRAVDGDGRPVPALRVCLRGDTNVDTLTEADGSFELAASSESGTVDVADPAYVAVRTGAWNRRGDLQPVLVVAPAIQLAGHVVDTWGRGVGGAQVVVALPDDFATRFRDVLDASYEHIWRAETAADGGFALERVPAIVGSELRAAHADYAPIACALPAHSDASMWLEMVRPQVAPDHALRGLVLHADGRPAHGAYVALGLATTRSDATGAFTLDLSRCGPGARLTAVTAGEQPAVLDKPQPRGDGPDGWPAVVELRLGPPACSIAGRVVDENGASRGAGVRVWVAESTNFGVLATLPLQLEAMMAGGAVPDEAVQALAQPVDPDGQEDFGSASPALRPDALVHWVETDADGRFELGGLLPRPYRLAVLGKAFAFGDLTDPIAAPAQGIEVVVASASTLPRLRGRVVTASGEPIAGVRVTPWLPAVSVDTPVRGGDAHAMRFFLGPAATTDSDGVFVLSSLPRRHTRLHLIADCIVPSYTGVEDASDPENFVVPVLARAHLEVEVAPGGREPPDAIRVRDANGLPVTLLEMRADGYSTHDTVPLRSGRSGVLTVTSDATTLEFLRSGEVVDSEPIEVHPGALLRIRR
ncbi:MAG: sigma-70 family RNA polymerase sigma factor [Planctomycetota bacterium]